MGCISYCKGRQCLRNIAFVIDSTNISAWSYCRDRVLEHEVGRSLAVNSDAGLSLDDGCASLSLAVKRNPEKLLLLKGTLLLHDSCLLHESSEELEQTLFSHISFVEHRVFDLWVLAVVFFNVCSTVPEDTFSQELPNSLVGFSGILSSFLHVLG
jgi:hypothetical protein